MGCYQDAYADATFVCLDVKELLLFWSVLCNASLLCSFSPAVLRRRARLYPFGESVYERFLPNSLRSDNVRKLQSLRVPSGALMGL